jgi:hypothetical protein
MSSTASSSSARATGTSRSHTYWNPRPDPTRYLLVMTPRIRALIDALHAVTSPTPETVAAVFEEHESEYLGWP